MKRLLLSLTLISLILLSTYGQGFSKEFGKVWKADIELKQYSKDKDAEAVVLFDIATSHFEMVADRFEIVFERTTRIKILSEAGIDWAEVEIPYYQEGGIYEEVARIEAYSYIFENGHLNKTQFDVSNVYTEKINSYWNVKKFAIPNVKPGSIIEYKYRINSQYMFNLRDWEFQWRIPVVYSEYKVKLVPFYEYAYILQGANKFDSFSSYQDNGLERNVGMYKFHDAVSKFVMKDVPAFKDEEFISSINDYLIKLDFQLAKVNRMNGSSEEIMTTWEGLIKDILKNPDFGKYVNKSEKLGAKLISEKDLDSKSDKEKFNYILEYVKSNYNWNGHTGKYATKSPNKFNQEKHGNCADINLFTTGLLRSAGIEAYPVLITTRQHGKIRLDYPFSHFFNYVVILAKVNGAEVLTDATDVLCLNDRVPTRCINDKGLIVKKDNLDWIKPTLATPSEINTVIQIEKVTPEIITAGISKTATEYNALNYRNSYGENLDEIKKSLEKKSYTIEDSGLSVKNQRDIEKPYTLSYKLSKGIESFNEKIYISPFLNEVISDNPLKQKTRAYPIDMVYPTKRKYLTIIPIPEGYEVNYLPSAQRIRDPLFDLTYSASHDDKQIIISLNYYFKKSVYSASTYSKIKSYYSVIVKKGNEKVALSKLTSEN